MKEPWTMTDRGDRMGKLGTIRTKVDMDMVVMEVKVVFPSRLMKLGVREYYQNESMVDVSDTPGVMIAGILERELCDMTLEATKAINKELDRIFYPGPVRTENL